LDDAAAVVLASALTLLQRLCLGSYSIVTWSMVPVVGRLTGLRELALRPSHQAARPQPLLLQHLSTLTGLTWLYLPALHCSQDSEQQLLTMIPGLRGLSHAPYQSPAFL
jgi:hypothetical protein